MAGALKFVGNARGHSTDLSQLFLIDVEGLDLVIVGVDKDLLLLLRGLLVERAAALDVEVDEQLLLGAALLLALSRHVEVVHLAVLNHQASEGGAVQLEIDHRLLRLLLVLENAKLGLQLGKFAQVTLLFLLLFCLDAFPPRSLCFGQCLSLLALNEDSLLLRLALLLELLDLAGFLLSFDLGLLLGPLDHELAAVFQILVLLFRLSLGSHLLFGLEGGPLLLEDGFTLAALLVKEGFVLTAVLLEESLLFVLLLLLQNLLLLFQVFVVLHSVMDGLGLSIFETLGPLVLAGVIGGSGVGVRVAQSGLVSAMNKSVLAVVRRLRSLVVLASVALGRRLVLLSVLFEQTSECLGPLFLVTTGG